MNGFWRNNDPNEASCSLTHSPLSEGLVYCEALGFSP